MLKSVDPRQNFPTMEARVRDYWKDRKIFKETVKDDGRPAFRFFDGPPFVTGLPHYGHVVGSLIKDAVPRYWTMKGYRVERRWGWDCHGLPIENLIEKEMGIANKQAIEDLGVGCFNDACRASVLRYADYWKEFIPLIGRWVDMENDYKTMNPEYTESIWWVFAEIYKKGLVYEGYKAMHLCPRCGTTLSNFEVTQGYKDLTDLSATVKFKLERGQKIGEREVPEDTFVLAWTTTPWTLPGNVALAVGENVDYVVVQVGGENYVFAKEKLEDIKTQIRKSVKDEKTVEPAVLWEFKGKDLIGLAYEPLIDFYARNSQLENRERGWKIYAGDFVATEEGTGIVHIAPAFGEDDMALGKQFALPFAQHVGADGKFQDFFVEMGAENREYFADGAGKGREVKPKRNPRETDEKVVKFLETKGVLFGSDNYKHSYPHCWRCDTPLLNYAAGSWFVEVTKLKEKLIANNQKVHWMPAHIKDGRFGKWLEEVRDWAVSRSRFWGAPIPVWKCEKCDAREVVGSIDEMRAKSDKCITKFTFVRHGQAENNLTDVRAGDRDNVYHLTPEGKRQVHELAETLQAEDFDRVVSSPLLRATETAEILNDKLKKEIELSDLVREYNFGGWNGLTNEQLRAKDDEKFKAFRAMPTGKDKYAFKMGGDGENHREIEARVREFIKIFTEKHRGQNVLVVSHGGILGMVEKIFKHVDEKSFFSLEWKFKNAETLTVYVNEFGEPLDLHKPYIDEVSFKCPKCDGKMKISGEVFDCWFESGAMPYAQLHYPFQNHARFEESFPADFIAEGVDQTRGWFYTLMVLGAALFDEPAFRNVVVNGIVLTEDGQKMSKRLNNYPDPRELVEKYGADALRYYLFTSPVVRAEALRFSERGVDEVLKRFILTLWNTYAFWVSNMQMRGMKVEELQKVPVSENIFDRWILAKLNLLIEEVRTAMDVFDLMKAARPLREFIDELSNWYVRRSRRRFTAELEADRLAAFATLRTVLVEFSKVAAPFMPFVTEEIYGNLTGGKSVHLEEFPIVQGDVDEQVLREMALVRSFVSLGLAARVRAKRKVRQPLARILLKKDKYLDLDEVLIGIIQDELNVKVAEVVSEFPQGDEWVVLEEQGLGVALDVEVNPQLEREGLARELMRQIQALRKTAGLKRGETVDLKYKILSGEEIPLMLTEWQEAIRAECSLGRLMVTEVLTEAKASGELRAGEEVMRFAFEGRKEGR